MTTDLEIPRFIDPDITEDTIRAIARHGCASGVYMPAVTYFDAKQTMANHGEELADYLENRMVGIFRFDPSKQTWGGFCVDVVTYAVELWANEAVDQL